MRRTKWYSSEVKPVRYGVYERKLPDGRIVCTWWDNGWGCDAIYFLDAKWWRSGKSYYQSLPWRGLAQEQKQ